MRIWFLIGINLLFGGLALSLLSWFIIESPQLTASSIALCMIGAVLLAVLSSNGQRTTLLGSLENYQYYLSLFTEEFGIENTEPLFIPSSISGGPAVLLTLNNTKIDYVKSIPKRIFCRIGNVYALRFEPPLSSDATSVVLNGGITAIETFLRNTLVAEMEIVRSVKVAESAEGDEVLVELGGVSRSSNSYSLVYLIGSVLAEGLNTLVSFKSLIREDRKLRVSFNVGRTKE